MKISGVSVYRQWQPFADGTYTCSGNRSAEGFDSTIVRVDTDAGVTGWGEMAPLGSFYSPAFVGGARAGLAVLAPLVIGLDPRATTALNSTLDLHLNGHPYAKSALDMACWDIAARAAGAPLALALGGSHAPSVELYRSISQADPATMAATAAKYIADGYRRIQVKVGLDPDDDVERMHAVFAALPSGTVVYADANAAWTPAQARRFLRRTADLEYTLEQPCGPYDANRVVRDVCDRPLVLDESIDGIETLLRVHADRLADGVTIKISRVGGITRARLIRDLAVEMKMEVTVEDTGGADIDTAAMAHLSVGIPDAARTHTVDFHNWVTVSNGTSDLRCEAGTMTAPTGPGLGVEVDPALLGDPVLVVA